MRTKGKPGERIEMTYTIEEFFGEAGATAVKEFRGNVNRPSEFRPAILRKDTDKAIKTLVEFCLTMDLQAISFLSEEQPHKDIFAAAIIVTDWTKPVPKFWFSLKTILVACCCLLLVLFFLPEIVGIVKWLAS